MSRRTRRTGNRQNDIGYPCKNCGSENTTLNAIRNMLQCKECGAETEYTPEDIVSKNRRSRNKKQASKKKLANMSKVEKIKYLTHKKEDSIDRTMCGLPLKGKFENLTLESNPSEISCERCITNM